MTLEEVFSKIESLNDEVEHLEQVQNKLIEESISRGDTIPSSVALLIEKNKILGTHLADSAVIIKGQFKNNLGHKNNLKLIQKKSYQSNFTSNIPINHNGYFSKEIFIPKNGIYELVINNKIEDIYVQRQHILGIVIDSFNQPRYIGSLACPNQYLNKKRTKLLSFNQLGNNLYLDSPTRTKIKLDSILSTLKNDFELFKRSCTDFSEFNAVEEKNIFYKYAYHMMEYDQKHLELTSGIDSQLIDRTFLNEATFEDGKVLELSNYQKFIFAYNHDYINSLSPIFNTLIDQIDDKYKSITSAMINNRIKEFVITDLLYEVIKINRDKNINPLIQKYRNDVSNIQYQDAINRRYTSLIPVSKGSLAPQILGTTLSGDKFKLSDLNGQFVYIFIWATWCGPCKVELPSYRKMVEELKDKNIVFLGISVDRSKVAWKNSLIYDEFPGRHVLVSGDWNSPLIKDYQVQTIPQFILIDPKGEIIDLQAPKPTDKAYEYLLNLN